MLKCGNFTLSFYRGQEKRLQKAYIIRSTLLKLFNQVFCVYSFSIIVTVNATHQF